ncbi:MAG: hypothetical protein COZ06_05615 [Armatimonadetes bacterium CG_4_10_14_3_um_filter_66_18]|nr:TolC family protein [Armatimonadota bacterium]OIP06408.1 MAG: hypothetical protein AUJ96_09080 [Armatimonadetes bacterium CG2_30_66_41]PIU90727.1 MAG: hypothetical protein COS65_24255 [Armatimonadetes bacterium CG06_land_8_20_14_3_00_66_21]PIX42382.1 MAG: hypothetical protein COZ57_21325 [Armatimonadetes bacterium CG_4_8_14_3_um_filter_66_20]PIY51159.1 MAG: hypothetical protein COZ06_05615 [Armatimonadetes bacterium CG_4_10_14_3_um_filter_66_18]PIZ48506.1 MAG: hypothetical protein COY42_062
MPKGLITFWLAVLTGGVLDCALAQEPAPPDLSQPLSLAQCLGLALDNHPSVKAAAAGVEAAQHRVTESKSSRFPSLDLTSNWSRFQSTRQGFAIGSAGSSENRETALSASYLFLDSGQRKTVVRQAGANAGASVASLTSTERDTALAVVQAYYSLLTAQKLKALRAKVVTSAEQHVAAAQAGFDAGTTAKIDILRAQTELANAKVDVVAADGAIQRAVAVLRNAMGMEAAVPLTILDQDKLPDPQLELTAAQQEALSKRPELRQQDYGLAVAWETARSAKINAGPALSFTGGFDRYLDSSRDVTDEWVLRATMSMPLFDGKQSRSRVESAKADLVARREQRERERQSILLEVERGWISLNDAKARIGAADAARAQADENLALNEASYVAGVATMVEIIDARSAAAQAETNQIQALYDHNLAVMQLRYALGRDLIEEEVR